MDVQATERNDMGTKMGLIRVLSACILTAAVVGSGANALNEIRNVRDRLAGAVLQMARDSSLPPSHTTAPSLLPIADNPRPCSAADIFERWT